MTVTLTRLLQYHATHGDYVDPENDVWGFPHLYAERWNVRQPEENMTDEKDIDDVFEDRNLLACALAQATHAPSGWKPDPENDAWAIVWIETPMGQVSWHVPREMAEKLAPPKRDSEYDGYDREIKNDRLASWAQERCWS